MENVNKSMKYKVSGMSCAACSRRVELAVGGVDGVDECTVNLLTGDMIVIGRADESDVIYAVVNAGYGAVCADMPKGEGYGTERDAIKDNESPKIIKRLIVSAVLSIALMYFSMGHMIGLPLPEAIHHNPLINGLIQMLLAALVMVINQDFFISGAKGILHLAPNMNTLVSLGSLASFAYSFSVLISMSEAILSGTDANAYLHELYFESAAMILTLITVGKLLESKAKGKTTDAIRGLVSLRGKTATVIRDGAEHTVSVDDIRVGDIFRVRPGESVPTDAVIIEGTCALDESMLTGESLPRDAFLGDNIYGGTLNQSGFITARATKVGEGTVLSSIINMVREASGTKAPIAKLADKVSGVFVPGVMAIALITFFAWLIGGAGVGYAISRGISVLVISCPCALGLATPVAIMVGSGVGARRGVLYKNAAALEECGRIRTVVFDKTGTLTTGTTEVSDIIPADGVDEKELFELAYSVEFGSEHPLGRAIVKYAEEHGVKRIASNDFKAISGKGVYANIDGKDVYGISFSYACDMTSSDLPREIYDELCLGGKTPLVFLENGSYKGMIAVIDKLKNDAKDSVSRLKSMGIKVVMLSGDNERTAGAVALSAGIDNVVAGVMPDGKESVIRELSLSGKVAMVGDGINDAPALTRADVGIAIGTGTEIAIDSADVVLMGNCVSEAVHAIGIGRATLMNIRENLFWAFIYNCIGIPMAAGLFGLSLSPMIGAAMMSLSSFSVVMNALRLNLWKPKKEKMIGACAVPCEENGEAICEIKEEIKETKTMTATIKVEGMMCPHCEARVKKVCEEIDGVVSAVASHKDGTVVIDMQRDLTAECRAAIADAGYDVITD